MTSRSLASETAAPIDDVDVIAKEVREGRCILFLGAGVHHPPPSGASYSYPEEQRPDSAAKLAERLASRCRFARDFPNESIYNLQRVALCFERTSSRWQLIEEVKQAVHEGKAPSPALRMLAKLDFPLIVTTNYDRLMELALSGVGKDPIRSIFDKESDAPTAQPPRTLNPKTPFLLKLHGDVMTRSSMVITDEDYIDFVMRMNRKEPFDPIPDDFKYYFKRYTVLFIGYSLLDYNLRLLFKTLRWRVDQADFLPAYSVDPDPDPLILDVWHNEHRYVNFLVQDLWAFIPRLYERLTGTAAAP